MLSPVLIECKSDTIARLTDTIDRLKDTIVTKKNSGNSLRRRVCLNPTGHKLKLKTRICLERKRLNGGGRGEGVDINYSAIKICYGNTPETIGTIWAHGPGATASSASLLIDHFFVTGALLFHKYARRMVLNGNKNI